MIAPLLDAPRGPAFAATGVTVPDWRRAFEDLRREHGYEPLHVEGTLPADLRGTLYRAGAARFNTFQREHGHWFDGDGAVSAVRFGGGGAEGAIRLVQSRGLADERAAGRPLHAGYDTPPPAWARAVFGGRHRAFKNTGNTAVVPWQGRLFAAMEGFPPTEIDASDLSTRGETDLDGVIRECFAAHPHRVPSRATTYGFGARGMDASTLDLYALPDAGPARHIGEVKLPGHTMVHDYIVTERWLVFVIAPLRLDVVRLLLHLGTYAQNLRWSTALGTTVLLVSIDDPRVVRRVNGDAFFAWHFANAWDEGDDVVFDCVAYPDFRSNDWLRGALRGTFPGAPLGGRYTRFVVRPEAGTIERTPVSALGCDFPQVHPTFATRPHRYAWVAAHASEMAARTRPFDALARLDTTTGAVRFAGLGADCYPSEPVVVPRGDTEEACWVLTQVYDARRHRSAIVVVDGAAPERVVARVWFDQAVPIPFHGAWVGG